MEKRRVNRISGQHSWAMFKPQFTDPSLIQAEMVSAIHLSVVIGFRRSA
jgi:hypothetical protein